MAKSNDGDGDGSGTSRIAIKTFYVPFDGKLKRRRMNRNAILLFVISVRSRFSLFFVSVCFSPICMFNCCSSMVELESCSGTKTCSTCFLFFLFVFIISVFDNEMSHCCLRQTDENLFERLFYAKENAAKLAKASERETVSTVGHTAHSSTLKMHQTIILPFPFIFLFVFVFISSGSLSLSVSTRLDCVGRV